jgi:hypothetical protein
MPKAAERSRWATEVDVRNVTVLEDGSAGALIDTIFPDAGNQIQTDYFFVVEKSGRGESRQGAGWKTLAMASKLNGAKHWTAFAATYHAHSIPLR